MTGKIANMTSIPSFPKHGMPAGAGAEISAAACVANSNHASAAKGSLAPSRGSRRFHFLNRCLSPAKNIIALKELLDLAFAPLKLINLVDNCFTIRQSNIEEKIDLSLEIVSDFKEVAESGGTVVAALEDLKAIPITSARWATPFAAILSVFSIASIVSNVRTCLKTRKLMREIEAAGSYRSVLNLLEGKHAEDHEFFSKVFHANDNNFADALVNIELLAASLDDKKQAEQLLGKALKTLKGRVRQNIVHSALSIVASTIAIIGTAVLLATPLSPVGWLILGGGAFIDLARMTTHKICEYKFARSINLKRSKWEWATC